jgi:hypothetical protein
MSETRIPFSNGTECDIWRSANCDQCAKDCLYDTATGKYKTLCDIEEMIAMAGPEMDGRIPVDLLDRAGLTESHWKLPARRCLEFEEPTP